MSDDVGERDSEREEKTVKCWDSRGWCAAAACREAYLSQ